MRLFRRRQDDNSYDLDDDDDMPLISYASFLIRCIKHPIETSKQFSMIHKALKIQDEQRSALIKTTKHL